MSIFRRKAPPPPPPPPACEVRIELEQTAFDRWNYHVRHYRNGKYLSSFGNAHTGYSTKGIALSKAAKYDETFGNFDDADVISIVITLYQGTLLEWFGRDNDHN